MSRRKRRRPQSHMLAPQVPVEPLAAIENREPEYMPNGSMMKHVARARREMGEQRWAELNAEWAQ